MTAPWGGWSIREPAMSAGLVLLGLVSVAGLTAALLPRGDQAPTQPEHQRDEAPDQAEAEQQEQHEAHEADGGAEPAPPVRLGFDEEGRRTLQVSSAVQARIGLVAEPLSSDQRGPQVRAYGRLEEDPSGSFTLRSPMSGYLLAREGTLWPRPGASLSPGTVVGLVRPRLTSAERIDITARLTQAHSQVGEVQADLAAAKASYESKKKLVEGQKMVSDRALEEAEAKLRSDEARLAAATQMVRLLEEAIADDGDRAGALPLAVPAAGEVVDVLAQPGEAVESGQALLRTANLDHLIARVTIPAAAAVETMPLHARLQGFAPESWTLHGTSVCGAAAVGGTALGQTFLVSIDTGGRPVRPGTPVEAVLELAGPALEGVVVPRSAVIRFGGSAFVYVQTQDEEFTRTPIETYAPDDAGWFVSAGLSAGDRVVVIAAGSLLSEELRAQIEAEEEGEE